MQAAGSGRDSRRRPHSNDAAFVMIVCERARKRGGILVNGLDWQSRRCLARSVSVFQR